MMMMMEKRTEGTEMEKEEEEEREMKENPNIDLHPKKGEDAGGSLLTFFCV